MSRTPPYEFCVECGRSLQTRAVEGQERPFCVSCDRIYFPDLKVAAAVLVEKGGKILLVRRGIDPHQGRWTLPAGFVDAGEDPKFTAQRECLEETGLIISITELVEIISGQEHTRGAHLVILYRAEVRGGELIAGDDADEVGFFGSDELPPLAFEATEKAIDIWLAGR